MKIKTKTRLEIMILSILCVLCTPLLAQNLTDHSQTFEFRNGLWFDGKEFKPRTPTL